MKKSPPRLWGILASICVGFSGLLILYRGFWRSGGDLLQGDPGDGRLTAFIATHWLDPLRWGSWTDLGIFDPALETIGYSDWLLIHGLLSWLFAFADLRPEVAFQWSLIALSVIGYAGMVTFLRTGPRVPWVWAITGGFVFGFSNATHVAGGHPQLAAIALLPVLALVLLASWRSSCTPRNFAWAIVTGAVAGILVVSAFYIFFFLLLMITIGGVLVLLWPDIRKVLFHRPRRLVAVLAGVILGLLPFLVWAAPVYLRALSIGASQRPESDRLFFSLVPVDYINVSNSNAIWGWLVDLVYSDDLSRAQLSEWGYAPTLTVWLLVILAIWAAWSLRGALQTWERVGIVALATGLVLEFLIVRIGSFSPWTVVAYVPGADAIRAMGRLQLVAAFALLIGVTILLSRWIRAISGNRRGVSSLCSAVLVFVCLEQVNLAPPQTNGPDRRIVLGSITAPPFACESFVVLGPTQLGDASTTTQIDAMFVGRNVGIKTMNGYSGIEPEGWNLEDPSAPDYRARVKAWISQSDAEGVTCGLDLATGRWTSPEGLQVKLMKRPSA